jgi:hypothetical protein
MPVILAIWEAEIRRIMVQGQLREIVHETLNQSKMDWWFGSNSRVCKCNTLTPNSSPNKKKMFTGAMK